MKKIYLKSLFFTIITTLVCFMANAQSFTAGNLAVFVANASANNTTGTIVEFSTTGTGVVSHAIPDGAGVGNGLRFSGSATSTAYLANSNDGSLLAFTGANSSNTASNVNTLNPRAVGSFNNAGTYALSTTYTGTSGNQTRCATSIDNANWFVADQGGLYTNGSSAASPTGNLRGIKSFGGTVYVGQQSTTAIQVATASAPTGGTITGLPGLSFNNAFQDFYLISSGSNGSSYDVLYVISNTSATAGTIAKFSLVAGSWAANGTYATTFGGFGMAAKKNGGGADIFVSTGAGATVANSVIKLNDAAGYNTTINITTANNVTLYTTGAGTIIKGVAFAPVAAAVIPTVNLSVSSNTASEAAATVITVTATASSAVTGNQTVSLAVTGANVTAGDYTLSNTTITILNGNTTGTVTFTVVDDAVVESTETAVLTISNPSSGITLGSTTTQNIDITDNEIPNPAVDLSVSSNAADEAAATTITVTATASAPVTGNQTVDITVGGAGITLYDYILPRTFITIPDGATTGTTTFKIRRDAETEGTETAVLTILNPSSGISLGTTTSQNIAITDFTCLPLIRKSTATSTNGAEISAFDVSSKRIYTVAGPAVEYYTLSNTATLSGPNNVPFGFTSPGNNIVPNSVSIKNGIVAASYAIVNPSAGNAQQPGVVAFYTAATGAYINHVTVGYLPDMVIFSPDGTKVLTANEGEPNSYGQGNSFDPEGSVSIIDISGGVASATVTTAGFTSFNPQIAALRAAGVRIFGPGATVAQDLEPEYIAFSDDGTKAYVTLQENNAVAEVDIASATVLQILPLDLKDHSTMGSGLDASDRDSTASAGKINIQNWPIYGMYMPDAISGFTVGGNRYFITANEGDSRSYTGFSEEIRVGNGAYVLDPFIFPDAAILKLDENLGRLQLTNATGDTDNDGLFDEIHAFGARSFSIWNNTFSQVYDSGDQLEQITAAELPGRFNADNTSNTFATFDTRSDNKGPEPEAATTGTVDGVLYAFIGVERSGDIFVYDISNPNAPVFKQFIDNPADLGIEGLVFVPAYESPTGKALIIASAEISNTVTVYEFSLVPGSLPVAYSSVNAIQGVTTFYGDCNGLITKINQGGANPVSGDVNARVWVESTVPLQAGFPFVQRHYEITPASPTDSAIGTARITLYFTQAEFDEFNNDPASSLNLPAGPADAIGIANLRVGKYPGISNDGSGLPYSYTTGAAIVINPADADIIWNATEARWEVSFDVTGFSGFIIQTNNFVLPVTLLAFNATAKENNALVQWKIANEINHDHYEVWYSTDGSNFTKAGHVLPQSGTGEKNYSFTHVQAASIANKVFYRLKMVSTSGAITYSDIVPVRFGIKEQLITDVYPNPAKEKLNIVTTGNAANPISLVITDMSGRTMLTKQITMSGVSNINISSFATGLYLLYATLPDGSKQQFKIIKE
jgi:hypothetical protein